MSRAADDSERLLDEIQAELNKEPLMPGPIEAVLTKWGSRIKEIDAQLDFVNGGNSPTCPATRERDTLVRATKEIRAACAAMRADTDELMEILLTIDSTNHEKDYNRT